jgi:hypothetical protein
MELENLKEAEAIIESAVRAKVKRLDLNLSHRYFTIHIFSNIKSELS